ncbi:hypothetical protein WOLCODRAFT_131742 [Wolfiporia cocos MD-104 SS10]|uniref:Heme haloperoxidase family profile domain-containing protein n=1 Tax=Wolfiporia cocos (strain MD-104) TaxID=742152 RepID=A0A2H3JYE2_WOLCO|nr:hypothetical protein WOLCODRAFT_131742 [Wolfiporia cocos MD-104 SS10]
MANDHSFQQPSSDASRSPCPALNALANHGHLPRDGRDLTIPQLVHALTSVYNLSTPLATMLSVTGVLTCGNRWKLTVNLHDLAKHDVIEHNGSLVHADAASGHEYAPVAIDHNLVDQLMSIPSGSSFTLENFAKARISRDLAIPTPLDATHAEIARGEAVLTLSVMGSAENLDKMAREDSRNSEERQLRVSKECIQQWFVEERIPDGWEKPSEPVGLLGTMKKSRQLASMIAMMQASTHTEQISNHDHS